MTTKTIKTDAQVREDAEMYLKRFEHYSLMRVALALAVREEVKESLEKEGKTFDEDSAAETFTACVVVIRSLLKEILGIEEECDCAPGECEKNNRVAEAEQRRKDDHVEAKEDAAAGVDPEEDAEDDNTDAAPEDALKLDASQELVDAAISLLLRALD